MFSFVSEIVLNTMFVNRSNESSSYLFGFQGKGGKHSHVTSISRRFFFLNV